MITLYKGVLASDLKPGYIPGTTAVDFKTAYMWATRIMSKKSKGAARHVRHGKSVVIKILFDGDIKDHTFFQEKGISEHNRPNCWTSSAKDKAQINTPVKYEILSDDDICRMVI